MEVDSEHSLDVVHGSERGTEERERVRRTRIEDMELDCQSELSTIRMVTHPSKFLQKINGGVHIQARLTILAGNGADCIAVPIGLETCSSKAESLNRGR